MLSSCLHSQHNHLEKQKDALISLSIATFFALFVCMLIFQSFVNSFLNMSPNFSTKAFLGKLRNVLRPSCQGALGGIVTPDLVSVGK